ncbi:class I adenylate-forming enzyme family protein [Ruania zhangjianzhongii]|uniref:class I adenylate-forming enzyme family protein n=1 Tax=Ruania zhangjianzhongii TaxID=2603206 RepID=UPI0011CA85C6|nr:fatty acid--CoA ligase family protein [Ruania zhangjianzhongii]
MWHLVPEAASVLRAAGLRPKDVAALGAFTGVGSRCGSAGTGSSGATGPERSGSLRGYGLTVAGVGIWAARRARHAPVLIDDGGPVSGTALLQLVAAMADDLRDERAVVVSRADDRHLVATLIAAGTVGVDVVLVGPRAGAEEVAAARQRADDLAGTGPRLSGQRRRAPAVVLHSSGTTGRPHPRTQRDVGLAQLPTLVSLIAALGLRRAEPMLLAAPVSHGHGLSALAAGLLLGSPVLLGAARAPDRGLSQLAEHRVRTWVGLPTQLADLITAADARPGSPAGAALGGLRRIVTGSAPLPEELTADVHRRLGEVLVNYYGSTEAGTVTIARPADLAAVPATVGRAATGVQIEIRDPAGRVAPVGQVGEVVLRSRWRAAGEPVWIHSKDRGWLDEAGRLVLVGRSDDAVLVGGHVVSLAAVTAWLRSRPGVQEVAVRVQPDQRLGSVLAARVRGTVDLPTLHAEARTALGDAAAPRHLLPW